MRWSSGDYQIAPIAARSTAMGRWRLTPPGYGGTCLPAGRFAGLTRHRRVIQHRDPSRGKANGGVSFNTADPSRGRLTEAYHSTPRTPSRGRLLGCGIQHREPLKGKADGGVSFNTANPSRGRLEGAPLTPRTHQGGRLGGASFNGAKPSRGRLGR